MPKTQSIHRGRHTIVIQELSPTFFIGGDIVPISFIQKKQSAQTQFEKVMSMVGIEKKETESKEMAKTLKNVLEHGVVSIDKEPFNINAFFDEVENIKNGKYNLKLAYDMFVAIIDISFAIFKPKTTQPIYLSKDNALRYHDLAKEYKKTPIEILCPNGGYTDLDAFTFNLAVFTIGRSNKNEIVKKINFKQSAQYE